MLPCIGALATLLQVAAFLFKPGFLAAGGASSALLEPLMRILSLGWSSAAVTNYVQGVSNHYSAALAQWLAVQP